MTLKAVSYLTHVLGVDSCGMSYWVAEHLFPLDGLGMRLVLDVV